MSKVQCPEDLCADTIERIWYWGFGVGKSHLSFQNFHPDTHYVKEFPDWKYYRGQGTIIFDDFGGGLSYWKMVLMNHELPRTVKKVIINSLKPPERIYHNKDENCQQLYKHFKVFKVSGYDQVEPWVP